MAVQLVMIVMHYVRKFHIFTSYTTVSTAHPQSKNCVDGKSVQKGKYQETFMGSATGTLSEPPHTTELPESTS
jgi:hypothetical protein